MATRSVYVSRLRRAFLLRAHPDRFRSHSPQIRKQQSGLIQAISDRMGRPDFLSYTYGEHSTSNYMQPKYPSLSYVLEQKDGSLKNHSLNLNDTVEGVLKSMVDALHQNGLTSLAPPPEAPPKLQQQTSSPHNIHWAPETKSTTGIDRKYDIHSNQGRNLLHFLASLDSTEIASRKASRMDVTAAASVVRRDYQFFAVDGTGLGWSSASLAILLRTLVDLFQEHSHKFHVSSFYPLRLVLSSEDQTLDLYGGILYLNPSSTPIQWLDQLLSVTPERLKLHKELRVRLTEAGNQVNSSLDVTFQKGHSCSSREYFELLDRLAHLTTEQHPLDNSTTAIALARVHVLVESPQACRRALLTKEGHIRVGASMASEAIISAVSVLLVKARGKLAESRQKKEKGQQTIKQIRREFGLQRVQHSKIVKVEQFVEALVRLVQLEQHEELKRSLAGNSLDIVGTGHFCHLGDDGSLVIPWDWN
jgi:hypothetical protein